MAFDPYHTWLSIPPSEQPPHHYRLLGLPAFEKNAVVIENAANRQMAHLRTFQSGKYSRQSQKLLNEVAAAQICLLSPEKKSAYDAQLREKLAAPAPPPATAPVISPAAAPPPADLATLLHDPTRTRTVARPRGKPLGRSRSTHRKRSSPIPAVIAFSLLAVVCVLALAIWQFQSGKDVPLESRTVHPKPTVQTTHEGKEPPLAPHAVPEKSSQELSFPTTDHQHSRPGPSRS